MTFGRVAEALPRAIRLVGWPKLVIFFFFFWYAPGDTILHRRSPHSLIDRDVCSSRYDTPALLVFCTGQGDRQVTIF